MSIRYGTDTPTKCIRLLTEEKLYTRPKAESEGNEIAVRWNIPRPRYVRRNIAERNLPFSDFLGFKSPSFTKRATFIGTSVGRRVRPWLRARSWACSIERMKSVCVKSKVLHYMVCYLRWFSQLDAD